MTETEIIKKAKVSSDEDILTDVVEEHIAPVTQVEAEAELVLDKVPETEDKPGKDAPQPQLDEADAALMIKEAAAPVVTTEEDASLKLQAPVIKKAPGDVKGRAGETLTLTIIISGGT